MPKTSAFVRLASLLLPVREGLWQQRFSLIVLNRWVSIQYNLTAYSSPKFSVSTGCSSGSEPAESPTLSPAESSAPSSFLLSFLFGELPEPACPASSAKAMLLRTFVILILTVSPLPAFGTNITKPSFLAMPSPFAPTASIVTSTSSPTFTGASLCSKSLPPPPKLRSPLSPPNPPLCIVLPPLLNIHYEILPASSEKALQTRTTEPFKSCISTQPTKLFAYLKVSTRLFV